MICRKCPGIKTEDDFHWKIKNIKRATICKNCHRIERKHFYDRNKIKYKSLAKIKNKEIRERNNEYVYNYLLQNPCMQCGQSNILTLDFDHRDRRDKFMGICQMIGEGYSINNIRQEIEKCDVLCANCHRIKTAGDINSFKYRKTL